MDQPLELLKSAAVASMLGVSQSMLCRWRAGNKGPPFIDLEGNPRYRLEDIRSWLDRQTRRADVA